MVKILKRISVKNPVAIACWPGMGEVAFRAGLFLKKSLNFRLFAKIENTGFFSPQGVLVQKGLINLPKIAEGNFYFYKSPSKKRDIILFLAEAQPTLEKAYEFGKVIVEFIYSYKVLRVFSFAAFPQAIEHTQASSVWISATHKEVLEEFSSYNLKVLEEGQISGLNGLFLGLAKEKGLKGACFLGEIPFYTISIENPKASLAVLEVLDKYLGLELDFEELEERAKFLEGEINKLVGYLKGNFPSQEGSPLSEEDVQRIRRELERFTKLPQSAREKIEELFDKASKDLSYASELKKFLDEWGVYKEYEDRFLDLFKKKRLDH